MSKSINKFNYQNDEQRFGGEIEVDAEKVRLNFYSQPISAKGIESLSETSFQMNQFRAERLRDDLTKALREMRKLSAAASQ